MNCIVWKLFSSWSSSFFGFSRFPWKSYSWTYKPFLNSLIVPTFNRTQSQVPSCNVQCHPNKMGTGRGGSHNREILKFSKEKNEKDEGRGVDHRKIVNINHSKNSFLNLIRNGNEVVALSIWNSVATRWFLKVCTPYYFKS